MIKALRIPEIIRQIHFIGVGSLPIVLFCVCFAAMVTILESSYHMKLVIQNDSLVPGFAVVLIIRELGAVVTALLVTSRVGASMAAEVGSMKVTEQLEALKMLGINPNHYLLYPRVVAGIIAGVLLTTIANVVCIFAAMLVSIEFLGFTQGLFWTSVRRFVEIRELYFAAIKGAAFGAVIPLIAVYCGFRCQPGAEGVGRATTRAVVMASITVIVIDFVLSYIFSQFY